MLPLVDAALCHQPCTDSPGPWCPEFTSSRETLTQPHGTVESFPADLCRGAFQRPWDAACNWGRMCVGEKMRWPCCVARELGHSISLACLTPGKKPVARLWTEPSISVSSLLSASLLRTAVAAAFSSYTFSFAVRYAVAVYLLSWIYYHSGGGHQDLRKSLKYLRWSHRSLAGALLALAWAVCSSWWTKWNFFLSWMHEV